MEAPVQEGDLLAGKYRVEKVLGFGGMGVVVSAFRNDLDQRVAVKFLSQAAAERPDAAERFRREARAAAKIKSEHVARVLDVGTLDTGLPYMVMEFLEGNDIADELRQMTWMPIVEAVEFILQAIEALAEAHAAGVVHRDLKPGNLFLARRADGSRRVKVLDFGISKALSGSSVEELSLTKTAALIGSPLYMAPEQMRSAKDVDTRADIWSLGAMLYEMLTGQPPYTGESIPQLCAALLHDDPIPLRQHRPEIPEGLEYAVLRCLMKDRNQRFPTVFELGRALLPYAMPSSSIHVERAERVLGVKDVTLSGMPMTDRPFTDRFSNPMVSTPAMSTPAMVTAPRPAMASTPQPTPLPNVMEPTVNSWGHTGTVQTPKRRGAIIAVGVVAALLAGAVGIWAAGRGDAQSASTKPVTSAATSGAEPVKVDAKPVEPVAALPEPVATVTQPASSAAIAETPPAPVAAPAAKPKTTVVAAPPRPLPKKPEPKGPDSGITDFGGRR